MGLNRINVSIDPQDIHYAEATFKRLIVREVYDGDYPNGVYHFKPIQNINAQFLVNFLREKITDVKIDLADPSGNIKLEYPVYLISKKSRNDMVQRIEEADCKLDEFIKNRAKKEK